MHQVSRVHRGKAESLQQLLYNLTGLQREEVDLLVTMGGAYLGKLRCKEGGRLVRAGERVSAYWRMPLAMEEVPFDPAWIVHLDESTLVAAKPCGLPTQGRRDADYMAFYELLKAHLPGYLGLHHRLDQDTSGLMLYSRDRALNKDVARIFADRLIHKTYLAVCRGNWPSTGDALRVDAPIAARRSAQGTRQQVHKTGKVAQTRLKLLARYQDWLLVEASPLTGRTHQIRVHLAHEGIPLHADKLYGGSDDEGGFLLHCSRLRWPKLGRLAAGDWSLPPPAAWGQRLPEPLHTILVEGGVHAHPCSHTDR